MSNLKLLFKKQNFSPLIQHAVAYRNITSACNQKSILCSTYKAAPFDTFHYNKALFSAYQNFGSTTFKLADIGEGIAEVELLRWYKNVGDDISEMDTVCEVQSDKAAVEITSRYSGKILKFHHNVGDMVKIGAELLDIEVEDDLLGESASVQHEEVTPPVKEEIVTPTSKDTINTKQVNASPSVRRFAKENGVDLSDVMISGKSIVTKADVEAYLKMKDTVTPTGDITAAEEEVPIKGFGRAMFKTMTESTNVPHLVIYEEVDITNLEETRRTLKTAQESAGDIKLTLTAFFIKALSCALLKHPILNSKVHSSGDKYTLYKSHNVSVAMDTDGGLVVPNIKNVEKLSLVEIQNELQRLGGLAKSNKLSPADLAGGTVSISNVGSISGVAVKSLLFNGQALIAGIGKTQILPRYNEEMDVVPRRVVSWGLSADHRHCDGATVARFSKDLKALLENPDLMLLTLR